MKCKECNRTDIQSKPLGLCGVHYAKWYRKNHQDRIRPTRKANYLRNRERRLAQSKKWVENNRERVRELKREQYKRERELMLIRQKTHHLYGEMKKKAICETCSTNDNLEFHHLKPYSSGNFKILCTTCHMKLHNKSTIKSKIIRKGGRPKAKVKK